MLPFSELAASIGETWRKTLYEPECPRFPSASWQFGAWAGVILEFCDWVAFPIGPFRRILHALSMRKWRVEWATMPEETRMNIGLLSAVVMPMTVVADKKRFARLLEETERKAAG